MTTKACSEVADAPASGAIRERPMPLGSGVSNAPLSSGDGDECCSGRFVSPHSAHDSIGEVAFVGQVGAGRFMAALLGDRGDVEDTVGSSVSAKVEPTPIWFSVAFSG